MKVVCPFLTTERTSLALPIKKEHSHMLCCFSKWFQILRQQTDGLKNSRLTHWRQTSQGTTDKSYQNKAAAAAAAAA